MIFRHRTGMMILGWLLVLGACAQVLSPGAALVNGVRISEKALDEQVTQQLRGSGGQGRTEIARQVLVGLIQQELVHQEAARRGIAVTAAQVEEQFRQIRGQFPTEEEFRRQLTGFGLEPETLRARISDSILVGRLSEHLAGPVTSSDLRKAYEARKDQFRQIKVKRILFAIDAKHPEKAALTEARDALRRLRAGESFAALAKAHSDDVATRSKGGVLPGFQTLANLDPSFARAAWAARLGVLTGPVRTASGWEILVTLAKRTQPLSAVEENLRQQISQQSGRVAIDRFISDAMRRATIVVNPKYGDWDAQLGQIVPHRFFEPALPAADQNAPGGLGLPPISPSP